MSDTTEGIDTFCIQYARADHTGQAQGSELQVPGPASRRSVVIAMRIAVVQSCLCKNLGPVGQGDDPDMALHRAMLAPPRPYRVWMLHPSQQASCGSETHCHVLGNEAGTTRQHGSPPSSKEGGSMRGSAIVRPVKPHVAGENQSGPVSMSCIQSRESGDEHSVHGCCKTVETAPAMAWKPTQRFRKGQIQNHLQQIANCSCACDLQGRFNSVSDEAERMQRNSTKNLRWWSSAVGWRVSVATSAADA